MLVRVNELKAVLQFAAKGDIRYYLNGVYLETGPLGARLVATDGHIMGVLKIEGEFEESSIIIPRQALDLIKAQARGDSGITFEYDAGNLGDVPRQVLIMHGESKQVVKEVS